MVRVQEQQAPEVCRTPLEQLCLTVKTRFGPEHRLMSVLSQMLTPPEATAIISAVRSLTALGALDAGEALTPLGRLLSQIPMDPRLATTCVFACMLRLVTSTQLNLYLHCTHVHWRPPGRKAVGGAGGERKGATTPAVTLCLRQACEYLDPWISLLSVQ